MNERTFERNRIRGLILIMLSKQFPHPLDAVVIRRTLATLGYTRSEAVISSYFAYLEQGGMVTIDERRDFEIKLVTITNKGLQVRDGVIADPMVFIEDGD